MEGSRSLFIPVILGTTRQGRMSLNVSRLITQEVAKQNGIETELIDIATVSLPTGDAGEASGVWSTSIGITWPPVLCAIYR